MVFRLVTISLFLFSLSLFSKGEMILSSNAFVNKGEIPIKYTMPGVGGKNISPPLRWVKTPQNVVSYAVTVVDLHPVAKRWVHWMIVNLPPKVLGVNEGASGNIEYGKEIVNSFGKTGYGGPKPPVGTGVHKYKFTVYALKSTLKIGKNSTLKGFLKAIKGKVLDESSLIGTFEYK